MAEVNPPGKEGALGVRCVTEMALSAFISSAYAAVTEVECLLLDQVVEVYQDLKEAECRATNCKENPGAIGRSSLRETINGTSSK